MGKAVGATMLAFAVGGGAMTLLTSVLGPYSEVAALALVGMGLFASSQALGGKLPGTGIDGGAMKAPEGTVP